MEPDDRTKRSSILDHLELSINRSDTKMCEILNYIDGEIVKRKRLSEVSNDPSYYHGMIMALLDIQALILKK